MMYNTISYPLEKKHTFSIFKSMSNMLLYYSDDLFQQYRTG